MACYRCRGESRIPGPSGGAGVGGGGKEAKEFRDADSEMGAGMGVAGAEVSGLWVGWRELGGQGCSPGQFPVEIEPMAARLA